MKHLLALLAVLPGLDARPGAGAVLPWAILLGVSIYLLVTAQPLGRPKPDLAERLRRLDVDERVRMEADRRAIRPLFRSRVLEAVLRPVLDDLGQLARRWRARFGLSGGGELERALRVARPGVEPEQFWGEQLVGGLLGLALLPVLNALDLGLGGGWPVWSWLLVAVAGFLLPHWDLARRVAARRARIVMELPAALDLLTIAVSAGQAPEQALDLVARRSGGVIGQELQGALRELVLGHRPLVATLEALAERNGVPELASLASNLRAAVEQGLPLARTLAMQAAELRERKRLHILAEGGRASVRMVLPVALFILPVLTIILLYPATVQLLGFGG
jgi:tight adherence protein C